MSSKKIVDRYPAEVFWSDEDEGFIAIAPDLPGSSAWGKTAAKALTELRHAISAWIEAAQAAGNPVPPPSAARSPDQFSGKVLLRMPRDLHADLSRSADIQGVSLNQYLVYLLTKRNAAETANASPEKYFVVHSNTGQRAVFSISQKPTVLMETTSQEHGLWQFQPDSITASVS